MNAAKQRTEDTIIAAMLAGFWSGILMSKLDAITLGMNQPVLHAITHWWPLTLILAGMAMLVRHQFTTEAATPVRQFTAAPVKERAHAR